MLLQDLPDDVLLAVLAKAARCPGKGIDKFSTALPLLAVCRQWRHLALPVVYADAYYLYWAMPADEYRRYTGRPIDKQSEYPREHTNVDLIVSAGCVNLVRRVYIDLSYAEHLFPGIAVVAARLKEVAAVWTRVEYLEVNQRLHPHEAPVEKVQAMANQFIGMFPGVCRLEMRNSPSKSAANALVALLAAGYAGQLRVYNGYPDLLPPGCVLERLERAAVTYNSVSGHHNQTMRPCQLQHLSISLRHVVCPWDTFAGDGGSGDQSVEFPNLISLKIWHGRVGTRPAIAHQHRLHFPQLQYLELKYDSDACDLLQHAVFPAHMARVVLSAPEAAFDVLCEIKFPTVEQLTVTVSSDGSWTEGRGHVGRFLAKMRYVKQTLFIECPAKRLLPELAPCTNLTSVTVSACTDIGSVMSFVMQLQSLQYLRFTLVSIFNLPAGVSIAPRDAHEPLDPLNTNLQRLSIGFHYTCRVSDMVTAAQYLVMRLPKLIAFSVPGALVQPLLDFARKYSRLYPHLENAERVFFGGS